MNASHGFATCVLLIAAMPAMPFEKFSARPVLTPGDVSALAGKSLAVVRAAPGTTRDGTVGSAMLMQINPALGVIANGQVARAAGQFDPGDVLEVNFAPEFVSQYKLARAGEVPFVAKAHWEDIAAVPSAADYLLYVRTSRIYVDDKGQVWKGHAWVGVALRIALLERRTARPMLVSDCYSDTRDDPNLTSLGRLKDDQGSLLGVVAATLAWRCMQHFATLLPEPAAIPMPPPELVDPLADYARTHPETKLVKKTNKKR